VGELEPGGDVPVVVESRDDDLVAGPQLPAEGAREREVECRHVLSEPDLPGRRAEEPGGSLVRLGDDRVCPAARLEGALDIRIRVSEASRDRVDHGEGHLGATWAVEEGEPTCQGGKLGARSGDVEGDGAHGTSFPLTRQA
jgi:hypothetical protein